MSVRRKHHAVCTLCCAIRFKNQPNKKLESLNVWTVVVSFEFASPFMPAAALHLAFTESANCSVSVHTRSQMVYEYEFLANRVFRTCAGHFDGLMTHLPRRGLVRCNVFVVSIRNGTLVLIGITAIEIFAQMSVQLLIE